MKKYKLKGGGIITADSKTDLVIRLSQNTIFGFNNNLGEFRKETAERCFIYDGSDIRTENCDVFIDDLITNEFIEVIE